jgi:membrane protease YdiL (CAAX protease family)
MSEPRRRVWTTFFIFLLFLIGLWLAVRLLFGTPTLPVLWQIGILVSAALLSLVGGFAALIAGRLIPRLSGAISTWTILAVAYLVPPLALVAPVWLLTRFLPASVLGQGNASPTLLLRPGLPWLFLIQTGFLALVMLAWFAIPRRPWSNLPPAPKGLWPVSVMAGLGLWLISVFSASLLAHLTRLGSLSEPAPSSLFLTITILAALLVVPAAEEYFFRRLLIERWQPRLGQLGAGIASAALFATLQGRPLLWLPAFLFGLGLHGLVASTGRLRAAILAHMLFNGLALALNWVMIL